MPMMVLRRNYWLSTTKGHSVMFEAGVPKFVSPAIIADAVAIGAEFVDAADKVDITPDAPAGPNSGPADATIREQQILDAINLLVAENHRDSFAASGLPKADAVSKLVDYKVDKREVQAVWTARAEKIASGEFDANGVKVA